MLWMWEEVCTNKRTWITWKSSHWRKPYPCPTCHKIFGCKGGLQLQVETHTGERMSACSEGTSHLPLLRSLKRRNHLHALNVTRGLQTQEKKRVMLMQKSLKSIKQFTLVKNCLHAQLVTGHSPQSKNQWELTEEHWRAQERNHTLVNNAKLLQLVLVCSNLCYICLKIIV